MELDILNRLGLGMSYSSIESVRLLSRIRCGFMLGTGPMVAPDSSGFEPWLEPDRVRCLSIPGKVSEVKKPSPCVRELRSLLAHCFEEHHLEQLRGHLP